MRLRAIVALAVCAFGSMLLAPAASAAPYPPTVCASLSVSTTNPLPGQEITVSGENFIAGASVRLELHTVIYVLKTVDADGAGSFTTTVKLPDGVTGSHTIVAATGAPSGGDCPTDPLQLIHIQTGGGSTSAGPGGGGTSFTGVDVLAMLIGAAALVGVGVALNRSGQRRRAAARH
jgi:hypothetical protein